MDRRVMLGALLGLVGVAACTSPVTGERSVDSGRGYTTKTIEGCEYIEVTFLAGTEAGYYSLTHKGNCKNPIHSPKPCTPDPEKILFFDIESNGMYGMLARTDLKKFMKKPTTLL